MERWQAVRAGNGRDRHAQAETGESKEHEQREEQQEVPTKRNFVNEQRHGQSRRGVDRS